MRRLDVTVSDTCESVSICLALRMVSAYSLAFSMAPPT